MINIKVGNEGISLATSGTLIDITAEILLGIKTLSDKLGEEDKESAERFKVMMSAGMAFIADEDEAKRILSELEDKVGDETAYGDVDDLDSFVNFMNRIQRSMKG